VKEQLGRYELVSKVAQGGMGEVFLAWQHGARGFRRPVIIKRIRADLIERDGAVDLFLHEARLGALLQHANITQVLDLGEEDGALFLAMELVEGPDLRTLTRSLQQRGERLPLPLATWVLARAADGVAFAHEANDPDNGRPLNLIHRDISPQNILLSRLGDVKLTDFGIAKSAARTIETQAGFVRGKLGYMSPEQLAYERVTARTDVYALGVVLYETITGERLYAKMSEERIIAEKVQRLPPPPSRKNPEVDEALDAIVMRALATKAADRYPTATGLSEALDRWARGAGASHDKRSLSAWLRQHADDLGVRTTQPGNAAAAAGAGAQDETAGLPAADPHEATAVSVEISDFDIPVETLVDVTTPEQSEEDSLERPQPAGEWDLPDTGRGEENIVEFVEDEADEVASTGAPLDGAQPTLKIPALRREEE
jgi:serine/threonine-protein kinase